MHVPKLNILIPKCVQWHIPCIVPLILKSGESNIFQKNSPSTSVSGDSNTIRTDSLLPHAAHVGQGVHQTLQCLYPDPTDA